MSVPSSELPPVEFGLSDDQELEESIKLAELSLGIATPAQRLQEAALLIDRPTLKLPQ